MAFLLFVFILITCIVLGFFVLIQNPKGGGLAGTFGGLGNQMMGAKQSTDVVEKGTWVSAAVLLVLTLGSFVLTPKTKTSLNEKTRSEKVIKGAPVPAAPAPAAAPQGQAAPEQQAAQPATAPAPADAAPAPQPAK
jgi:preprotein translocase subunit SecG